jgi:hypothetical protein
MNELYGQESEIGRLLGVLDKDVMTHTVKTLTVGH